MIVHKNKVLVIDTTDDLLRFNAEQLSNLAQDEENGKLIYVLPKIKRTPREMTIEKVGFLHEFLSILHPDKKKYHICEIIRTRYQVFLCDKQIYRNHKYYKNRV